MSEVMSTNVAKCLGPYWLLLAGLDITGQHWTSAEMPIYLDSWVLDTTSRTVQLQTGSQEVRGFEFLRLHPKVLVTAVCGCGGSLRAGANVANCSHTAETGVRKESCLRCSSRTST